MSEETHKHEHACYEGIERRKAHEDVMDDCKGDIKTLFDLHTLQEKTNQKCETFKGQVQVVGIIAMLIWFGSFMYTYNHKVDSIREHDKLHRAVNENSKHIATNDGKLLVIEDRYGRLINDIEKMNSRLKDLVEMLTRHDVSPSSNYYRGAIKDETRN